MVIMVSTFLANSSQAFSAISRRCGPSKANGLVTTATVSAPASLAISATTGEAARTGAAAQTASDKHHVGIFKQISNFVLRLFSRAVTNFRVHAGAQASG